jgi:L-alanine-DL-glutamate epimerase-like enolase superfamily enzyme
MQITRKGFLKGMAAAAVAGTFGRLTQALAVAQETSGAKPHQTRIADIQVFPYAIKETEIERIALGTEEIAENVLLRLRTADGITGWGESSPYSPVMSETQTTDVAMAKHLAEIVRGRDPFTIPKIVSDMDAFAPGQPGIKAAFEIALWDICGKLASQPICCMLGNYRDSFPTDTTIFLDTPSGMAEKAKAIVARGFKAVKVKVGEAPELDIERMHSVRAAVGDNISLRIDANQGWTPAGAVRALKGMEPLGIEFCEQPLPYWDWEGLKYVRNHSPMPIMIDESVHSPQDAITAVRMGACDMINIKLMKAGGISNGMRIAQIADAADMTCMLGCMSETRVALTAAAHVIAASRNIVYADLDSFLFLQTDPVLGGMEFQDGVIRIPNKPGLGLDIDAGFLKTLRPV